MEQSSPQKTCYNESLFQNSEAISDFLCPIGGGVLNNPKTDKHGHLFCEECIEKWLNKSNTCPLTNETMNLNEVYPVPLQIKKILKSLLVICENKPKGCEWLGSMELFYEHCERDCRFKEIGCNNPGCKEVFMKKDSLAHSQECLFRKIPCQFCNIYLKIDEMKSHYDQDCPKASIMCECGTQMEKAVLQTHKQDECPEAVVQCPLYLMGCNFKDKRKELDSHLLKNIVGHFTFMQARILEYERKIAILENQSNSASSSQVVQNPIQNASQNQITTASNFPAVRKCLFCLKPAEFLCCNQPNARKTYANACHEFYSCRDHSSHDSNKCMRDGRKCSGCNHDCKNNAAFCGAI